MICKKCGSTNNDEAKFCGVCGNNLNEEIEQLEEPIVNNQPATPVVNETIINETPFDTTYINTPNLNQNQENNTTISQNNTEQLPKKNNKTKLIIILIIIIALTCAILGVYLLANSEKNIEKNKINDFFAQDKPIRVQDENEMYRYIDTNGAYITDKAYGYATEYKTNYAIVMSETTKDDITLTVSQIIDKKGKVQIETIGSIDYYEELDVWVIDSILYDKNLKQISPEGALVDIADDDNKYFEWINSKKNTGGIMNSEGKITYTYKFEGEENYISVEPSETTLEENYCRVNVDGDKYAIVNCDDGTVAYNFTDNYIYVDDDNIFEIKNDDTYDRIEIVYIQNNKVAYRSSNEDIDLSYNGSNYITIRDDSKDYDECYSYLSFETLKETKETPEYEEDDEEDLDEWEVLTGEKKFSCSTGYGIMNDNKITLPCEWDYIEFLDLNVYKYLLEENKNYIIGEKENKTYIIDLKTQKAVAELNTTYINTDDESLFISYKDNDKKDQKVYNLLTGKTITVSEDYGVYLYSNYIQTINYSTDKINYYNSDGKLIYTEK